MIEVGKKIAAEKNFAYEPSLLVEMFADQTKVAKRGKKKVVNRALVLKDRGHTLNGREFVEPKFADFLPHIKRLNIGGDHAGIDETRNSAALFPKDERSDTRYDRDIIVEKITALLTEHGHGGTSKEATASRHELLKRHFKTVSKTEIEKKIPLDELRLAYNRLHIELAGAPCSYFPPEPGEFTDEIPNFDAHGASSAAHH